MYEKTRTNSETTQERFFLQAERSLLEQRLGGSLAQALGNRPLAGESPEELQWLIIEDRSLAEQGLVELRNGDEVRFKHVDDLTEEDRRARLEAENVRAAWLMGRLQKEAEGTDSRVAERSLGHE